MDAYLTPKQVLQSDRLEKMALSRYCFEVSREELNVNDYIASQTNLACSPKAIADGKAEMCQRKADLYVYLRDRFGAQTVGDAHDILRAGKVPESVIRVWMDYDHLIDPDGMIYTAVAAGAPKLSRELKQAFDDYWNKIFSA